MTREVAASPARTSAAAGNGDARDPSSSNTGAATAALCRVVAVATVGGFRAEATWAPVPANWARWEALRIETAANLMSSQPGLLHLA